MNLFECYLYLYQIYNIYYLCAPFDRQKVAIKHGTDDIFVDWPFIYGYLVSPSKITMTAFPLLLARRNGVDLYLFSISTVAP